LTFSKTNCRVAGRAWFVQNEPNTKPPLEREREREREREKERERERERERENPSCRERVFVPQH
jgi:hypothetical protein